MKLLIIALLALQCALAHAEDDYGNATTNDLEDQLQVLQQQSQDREDREFIQRAQEQRRLGIRPTKAQQRYQDAVAAQAAAERAAIPKFESTLQKEPDHFCVQTPLYDSYGQVRGIRKQCY